MLRIGRLKLNVNVDEIQVKQKGAFPFALYLIYCYLTSAPWTILAILINFGNLAFKHSFIFILFVSIAVLVNLPWQRSKDQRALLFLVVCEHIVKGIAKLI